MAVKVGEGFLEIVPQLRRGFERDVERGLSSPLNRLGGRLGQSTGISFASAFKVAGVAGIGAFAIDLGSRIAGGLKTAVLSAADLNETVDATGVIFGTSAGKVTAAAGEMSKEFGVVRNDFLQGANAIGAIVKAS